jgi:hypothetical protein
MSAVGTVHDFYSAGLRTTYPVCRDTSSLFHQPLSIINNTNREKFQEFREFLNLSVKGGKKSV